jgi:TolA-binding protein
MRAPVRRSGLPGLPRPRWRRRGPLVAVALLGAALLVAGCAKYNTFYNASKFFRQAEQEREDRIKAGQDPTEISGNQKKNYDDAIKKCQNVLDEYQGSGLTDDALFMMAKAYHRLQSYRMSIRKFDLLFANFPATEYQEEALFLQALNHMFIGDVTGSNELLERLSKTYPESRFQAEALRSSGENSFTLEDWEGAATAFREYLTRFPSSHDADRITYQLAQCLWELEQFGEAETLLQDLAGRAESKELAFRARLLRARCLYSLGRHEETAALVDRLRSEAETFTADGEVTLVEAENLHVEGRDEEAAPLLENMPQEWLIRDVAPRVNDLLGWIYFRRWDLDEARQRFQDAVRGATLLEDPDATRQLLRMLQDYLAAEQSLGDAKPERVPGLKLLQANALLFGMERPRLALEKYLEIAGLAAADSATVARALYGAYVVYDRHLALPDSAQLMAARLETEYPTSPQAFQLRTGGGEDLLTYLLELQEQEREKARASGETPAAPASALTQEQAAAVESESPPPLGEEQLPVEPAVEPPPPPPPAEATPARAGPSDSLTVPLPAPAQARPDTSTEGGDS